MFGPSITRGFRVTPQSAQKIRTHAMRARQVFGLAPDTPFFPMANFIESLTGCGITFHVVEPGALHSGVEACCFPEQGSIWFTEDTYQNACRDNPRARFTVLHELGHLVLCHTRAFNREPTTEHPHPVYEDSEWQANTFAAEFLMPADDIVNRNLFTPEEILLQYHVSVEAAQNRVKSLRKQRILD